jgi:hypothetical protein
MATTTITTTTTTTGMPDADADATQDVWMTSTGVASGTHHATAGNRPASISRLSQVIISL